ncbi:hypothetical protein BC832DRAFT_539153 [Gaertneriomyces semiglobifer]|nr:hypothetical protein BC832DRAFT_539153 [Gaertneriomyces semiglobifer]
MSSATDQRFTGIFLSSFAIVTAAWSLMEWNIRRSNDWRSYTMLLNILLSLLYSIFIFYTAKSITQFALTGSPVGVPLKKLADIAILSVGLTAYLQTWLSVSNIQKCLSLFGKEKLKCRVLIGMAVVADVLYVVAFALVCVAGTTSGSSVLTLAQSVYYNKYAKVVQATGSALYALFLVYVDGRVIWMVWCSQKRLGKIDVLKRRHASNQIVTLVVATLIKLLCSSSMIASGATKYLSLDAYTRCLDVAFEFYVLNKLGVTISNILKPLDASTSGTDGRLKVAGPTAAKTGTGKGDQTTAESVALQLKKSTSISNVAEV